MVDKSKSTCCVHVQSKVKYVSSVCGSESKRKERKGREGKKATIKFGGVRGRFLFFYKLSRFELS